MKTWLEQELARVSATSALAEAIRTRCTIGRARPLPENGRVEIDLNTVERDPADQARRQKPPLRRLGRKLGHHRLADPGGQAQ
jgi:hypothetical protein